MTRAILKDLSDQFVSPVRAQEAVIIGRSSSCQICFAADSSTVSRQHARVFPVGRGWAIEDLSSRNGTFVNDQPVKEPVLLKPNTRIMLGWGGPELLFTTEAAQPLSSASSGQPLSHTILFPLFDLHKDVWEGGYLLPVGITAICGVLIAIASSSHNVALAQITFSFLACTLGCLGLYQLCNRRKSLELTFFILFVMAIAAYGLISLRHLACDLKDQGVWCNEAFASIVGEELFKSIPILLCLFLGRWLPRSWRKRIQIQEPLDGILIAGVSATGLRLGQAIAASLNLAEFDLDLFFILLGLGPIAYSSLLGYCAGLFTPYAGKLIKPRQKFALLLYGYAGAFGLKAVQYGIDSLPESALWTVFRMSLSVGYSLFCGYILYAYVLKAKKLSERWVHL